MSDPLTRQRLTDSMCMSPGCTQPGHVLKARCHPTSGLVVEFQPSKGALSISCKLCRKHVRDVAVGGEVAP